MFSTALSLVAAITTGQLVPPILFVLRHPSALWWILALSMSSAVVQIVISFTIKRFGAVVFATIMTTRQFFSVLLSCIVFRTPLTYGQWWVLREGGRGWCGSVFSMGWTGVVREYYRWGGFSGDGLQ